MLNPLSPYRLIEWWVYWPLRRLLRILKKGRSAQRYGAAASGIKAIRALRLRRMMEDVGLRPVEVVYYDLTPLVPPIDRIARKWSRRWRDHPEKTVSRGFSRVMGTAYVVVARRAERD